jgi:UDP-glucose 4-epimerase
MNMGTVLVAGGAGYIGSHTVVALIEGGYNPVVVDNFCNSSPEAIQRVGRLVGREVEMHRLDLCDGPGLDALFRKHEFEGVIHLAGLKAVGESVQKPLDYYSNNLGSTLNLLRVMQVYKCRNLVFSSSATVYGDPQSLPIREDSALGATNPYGRTKLMIEDMLRDLANDPSWKILLLRYFNPVGAHQSGTIGDNPNGIPNNLFPYISQVAVGKLASLNIYGADYPTSDGTGVRDYIHVVDLAVGHVKALDVLLRGVRLDEKGDVPETPRNCMAINLGTGTGYSVLEAIKAFESASGMKIPYSIVHRRPGDIAACYADSSRARDFLGWVAQYDLGDMCRDAWRWQSRNPDGMSDRTYSL